MAIRPTIADVAREAHVSRQTVSRALNNKAEISSDTLRRVLEVIDRLDYRPSNIARGLATSRTLTIGLVVPDIANPFFADISRGADDAAHAAGYSLLLCNTVEDSKRESEVLRSLEQRGVDGVVLCSSRLPEEDLAVVVRQHSAVVLVNRIFPGVSAAWVDDALGARLLVGHLLRSNRRAIGFLAGPESSHSGRERFRGYREAFGASLDLTVRCAQPDFDGGYRAARELLTARPHVDAIMCHNDLVAIGAVRACADLCRRVPEDVAVTGADDIMLAALVTPPLTTLRIDRQCLGATAMQMLLEQLRGGQTDRRVHVLYPELVVRSSAP